MPEKLTPQDAEHIENSIGMLLAHCEHRGGILLEMLDAKRSDDPEEVRNQILKFVTSFFMNLELTMALFKGEWRRPIEQEVLARFENGMLRYGGRHQSRQ